MKGRRVQANGRRVHRDVDSIRVVVDGMIIRVGRVIGKINVQGIVSIGQGSRILAEKKKFKNRGIFL
jgi:hypothetical protein